MPRKGVSITYDGKTFPSKKALADYLGVCPILLRGRINKHLPRSEWAKPPGEASSNISPSHVGVVPVKGWGYCD